MDKPISLKQLIAEGKIGFEAFIKLGKYRRKIIGKKAGDWKKAKQIFNKLAYPSLDSPDWREREAGDFHRDGKEEHSLKVFEFVLPPIEGYPVSAFYKKCPICKQERVKYLVMTNGEMGVVAIRWLYRAKEADATFNVAKKIFSE